jgi:hypothetical protein
VPKHLIALEMRVAPELAAFIAKVQTTGKTTILTRELIDVSSLRHLDVDIITVSDYFQTCSPAFNKLFLETQELVRTWAAQPPLQHYVETLEYQGVRLWDITEHHTTLQVFRYVLWIEALRQMLRAESWDRVYFLARNQSLWAALQIALDDVGFQGQVIHIDTLDLAQRPARFTRLGNSSYLAIKRLVNSQPVLRNLNTFRQRTRQRARRAIEMLDVLKAPVIAGFKRQCLTRAVRHPGRATQATHTPPQAAVGAAQTRTPYLFLLRNYGTILDTLLLVKKQVYAQAPVLTLGYGKPFSPDQLLEHDIHYLWNGYISPGAWLRIIKHLPVMRQAWEQLAHDAQTIPTCTYRGGSLWTVMHELMCPRMGYVYKPQYPLIQIIAWIEVFAAIYQHLRPRVIATGADDHRQVLTAVQVARTYQIRSVYIQPAMHIYNPIVGHLYTDYGAVMDDYARSLHSGFDSSFNLERFRITGLPRWDRIAQIIALAREHPAAVATEMQAALGLKGTERVIMFATQPIGLSRMQQVIRILERVLARYPDTRLIIKLHPQEFDMIQDYESLLSAPHSGAARPLVVGKIDVYKLIVASDLVVTVSSNIGLEAAMLDRAVVIANLTEEYDIVPFVAQRIALGAYTEAELEQQIDRLLNDAETAARLTETRRAYFQANPQLMDGKATERVVNMLQHIATTQPMPPMQASRQEEG